MHKKNQLFEDLIIISIKYRESLCELWLITQPDLFAFSEGTPLTKVILLYQKCWTIRNTENDFQFSYLLKQIILHRFIQSQNFHSLTPIHKQLTILAKTQKQKIKSISLKHRSRTWKILALHANFVKVIDCKKIISSNSSRCYECYAPHSGTTVVIATTK